MKVKLNALARDYGAALAKYLKAGPNSNLKKAASLGRQAVTLSLETLALAKIHEQALLIAIPRINSAPARDGLVKRAQLFFIEANFQIERTHRAAAEAKLHWNKLNETLQVRTNELALSKRDLQKRMIQRKAAEETLQTRNDRFAKLLRESRSMQDSLRSLAHRVLSAQENERGQISRKLHDEIAQVLLGINVRLLTLEQKGSRDAVALLKNIASTQCLVDKSVLAMRRAAEKLRNHHEK
jgi:signal transduction histidine kinase